MLELAVKGVTVVTVVVVVVVDEGDDRLWKNRVPSNKCKSTEHYVIRSRHLASVIPMTVQLLYCTNYLECIYVASNRDLT